MVGEYLSAHIDGSDKSISDAIIAHVRNKQINSRLPLRLGRTSSNSIVGNDARIALRERDEDQYPATMFCPRDTTDGKLFHGSAVSDGTTCMTRHERNPHARQTEQRQKHDKCDDLQ